MNNHRVSFTKVEVIEFEGNQAVSQSRLFVCDDEDKDELSSNSCMSVDVYEILREIKQIRSELELRKSRFSHERHPKSCHGPNASTELEVNDEQEEDVCSSRISRLHRIRRKSISPVPNSHAKTSYAGASLSHTSRFSITLDMNTHYQLTHRSRSNSSSPPRKQSHPLAATHHSSHDLTSRRRSGSMPLKYHNKTFCPEILNVGKTLLMT